MFFSFANFLFRKFGDFFFCFANNSKSSQICVDKGEKKSIFFHMFFFGKETKFVRKENSAPSKQSFPFKKKKNQFYDTKNFPNNIKISQIYLLFHKAKISKCFASFFFMFSYGL